MTVRRACVLVLLALVGCAPMEEWRGPRHVSKTPGGHASNTKAYCACPPKVEIGQLEAMILSGHFGPLPPGVSAAVKPSSPALPPLQRSVFGEQFLAVTIDTLETSVGRPLETKLESYLLGIEPIGADLEAIKTTMPERLSLAVSRAEAALLEPSETLLRVLRALRDEHDRAKADDDGLVVKEKRAELRRVYAAGIAGLRRIATNVMADVLGEGHKLFVAPPKDVTLQLATDGGIEVYAAADILRAGGKLHVRRRAVAILAATQIEEVVERHRPSCAAYVTFK